MSQNLDNIIQELKNFFDSKGISWKFTNYAFFITDTYPCVCINFTQGRSYNRTYGRGVSDEQKTISVTYLDRAPQDYDKEAFIKACEELGKDMLTGSLLDIFTDYQIVRRSRDRKYLDDVVFIEEFILTGECEY